jgi:uncharacterized protein (DUF2164 family)
VPITLPDAAREEAIASIQAYAAENLDNPLGNLGAAALLDFVLEEIGPAIYNRAVLDVQERLQARLLEIDAELHEEPFAYWRRRGTGRRRQPPRPMISAWITRVSAAVLGLGGLALLFLPDVLLPALVSGFPAEAAWVGQFLGAAWLGVAALNWLQRAARLGGIYGRPVVLANLVLYFVSAMVLVRVLLGGGGTAGLWLLAVPMLVLAAVYGALLLRGPFDPLDR